MQYSIYTPELAQNSPVFRFLVSHGFPLDRTLAALIEERGLHDIPHKHFTHISHDVILLEPTLDIFKETIDAVHVNPNYSFDRGMFPYNIDFTINPFHDPIKNLDAMRAAIEPHLGKAEMREEADGRIYAIWKDDLVELKAMILLRERYEEYCRTSKPYLTIPGADDYTYFECSIFIESLFVTPPTEREYDQIRTFAPMHVFSKSFKEMETYIERHYLKHVPKFKRPPAIGFGVDNKTMILSLGEGFYRLIPKRNINHLALVGQVYERDPNAVITHWSLCLEVNNDDVKTGKSRDMHLARVEGDDKKGVEEFHSFKDAFMRRIYSNWKSTGR